MGQKIPDLSGKVILVTGGNAGIGGGFVKALAAHNPACIYLCARKKEAADEWIETVHKLSPKANIEHLTLDLSTFDSVRKCAEEFNSKADRLDYLFLNAGISSTAASLSKDGYETQFGVNHMGHALLTQLLMPKLLATRKEHNADCRIILTSSIGAHRLAPSGGLVLDQMKTPAEGLSPITRYGHSKLANTLFAKKLAQVYPDIITTSHHPGSVKTGIWGKADGYTFFIKLVYPIIWLTGISSDKGAETGIWCAVAPREKVTNGGYYEPYGKLKPGSKPSNDQKLIDELWEWTNKELEGHGGPGWAKE